MFNFFKLYNSLEDFFMSFFRGNEVEFLYNGKHFYILPLYNESKSVIGVSFGIANTDYEIHCFSKDDLYNASMGDSLFGKSLQQINIIWNNL